MKKIFKHDLEEKMNLEFDLKGTNSKDDFDEYELPWIFLCNCSSFNVIYTFHLHSV